MWKNPFIGKVEVKITITLSKLFAIALMIVAYKMDIFYDLKGQLFMWCTPFGTTLIVGKQGFDMIKNVVWKKGLDSA